MVRFHCEEDGERAFIFLCTESIAKACRPLLPQFHFLRKAPSLRNGNILCTISLSLPSTLPPLCVRNRESTLNEFCLPTRWILFGRWPGLWPSEPEHIYIELDFSQRLNRYRKTRAAIAMGNPRLRIFMYYAYIQSPLFSRFGKIASISNL